MPKDPITFRQFTILVIMYSTGSSILLIPATLAFYAKQDAWLSAIVGTVIGMLLLLLLRKLSLLHPRRDLFECLEEVFGKVLGKIAIVGYIGFGFMLSIVLLRYNGDFIDTQMMPDTPIEVIIMLLMTLVIIALTFGIGTVARTSELLFPWAALLLFLTIVFIIPQLDITFIQPVFEEGFMPVLHGSIMVLGIPFLELTLMMVIVPQMRQPELAGRGFLLGAAIGGGILIIMTLVSILVLGPHLSAIHLYPSFTLTKKINIGNFLQRIEAILAIVWFLTIFFKLTLVYYATAKGIARLFGLQSHRHLLWPLGMIAFTYALVVYPNIMYGNDFAGDYWTLYALPFGALLPLLLVVVSIIRRKMARPS